jgi:hypothetical protein
LVDFDFLKMRSIFLLDFFAIKRLSAPAFAGRQVFGKKKLQKNIF